MSKNPFGEAWEFHTIKSTAHDSIPGQSIMHAARDLQRHNINNSPPSNPKARLTKRLLLKQQKDLLAREMKSINIDLGKMSTSKKVTAVLSWTEGVMSTTSASTRTSAATENRALLQIHDENNVVVERNKPQLPSREQFMTRYSDTVSESLGNAYNTSHPLHYSSLSGVITSTLCEDVFTLVNMQWNVLHDYLVASQMLGTDLGDTVLQDGLLFVVRTLWQLHVNYRDTFTTDLERSCATANDFYRMMETMEEFWSTLQRTYPKILGDGRESVLSTQVSNLLSLYSSDAVYAAQRAHTFVVREIHASNIPNELFSREWEDVFTSNEVVLSMIRTMEDFLYDFHNYFCNDLLYRKLVDSLIRAMVCFYVTQLVRKADDARRRNQLKRNKTAAFANPRRALVRMMYDLELFRTYFENLIKELPSLGPVVEEEMSRLILVHECLSVAVSCTGETLGLEEFVIVVHKRLSRNMEVTRHFMGDLWFLAAPPTHRNEIYNVIGLMQAEIQMLSLHMDEAAANKPKNDRDPLKGIKLTETLQDLYEERILQAQFSVCAPCVQAIKTAQKNGGGAIKSLTAQEKMPLKASVVQVPLPQARHSEQVCRNLQEKLMEVLKLENLNFVKNRPKRKFKFELTTSPIDLST